MGIQTTMEDYNSRQSYAIMHGTINMMTLGNIIYSLFKSDTKYILPCAKQFARSLCINMHKPQNFHITNRDIMGACMD